MKEELKETEKEINSSPVKDIKVDSMPSDDVIEKVEEEIKEKKKSAYQNNPDIEKEVKANKDKLGINSGGSLKAKLERVMNLKKCKYLLVDIKNDIHNDEFVSSSFGENFAKVIDKFLEPEKYYTDHVSSSYLGKSQQAREDLTGILAFYKEKIWDKRVIVVNKQFIENYDNPSFEQIKSSIDKYCEEITVKEFSKCTVASILKKLIESVDDIDTEINRLEAAEAGMKKSVNNIDKVIHKLEMDKNLNSSADFNNSEERDRLLRDYRNKKYSYGEDDVKTKNARDKLAYFDDKHYDYKNYRTYNPDKTLNQFRTSPQELIDVITKNFSDMRLNVQLYGFLLYITTSKSKQTDSTIKAIRSLVK